jgi:hypothetical protein
MKSRMTVLLFYFGLTWVTPILHGQDVPPSPYVDKGACPFEGCSYRTWTAKRRVLLFAAPGSTRQIGVVRAGEVVTGVTGEVHSIPVLVHATADVPDPNHPHRVMIVKGKAFYVIHYLGEGAWLCWYDGHLTQVENFSDNGPFPKATWWVRIKTASGKTGWAISDGNFGGQDRLG